MCLNYYSINASKIQKNNIETKKTTFKTIVSLLHFLEQQLRFCLSYSNYDRYHDKSPDKTIMVNAIGGNAKGK